MKMNIWRVTPQTRGRYWLVSLVVALVLSTSAVLQSQAAGLSLEYPRPQDPFAVRTAVDRAGAVASIRAFAHDPTALVDYRETAKMPYAATVAVAELYYVGLDQYMVLPQSERVVFFGERPRLATEPAKAYDLTPRYTPAQLEDRARAFIAEHAPDIDLTQLVAHHGSKGAGTAGSKKGSPVVAGTLDTNYFFRWEVPESAKGGSSRETPFIQVGFTMGGTLLSYADTVSPLSKTTPNLAGTYIFASDGSYFSLHGTPGYWHTTNNQGYCGHWSCPGSPPYSMRWTYTNGFFQDNYAMWDPPDSPQNGNLFIFIPSVNATTSYAPYAVAYNGASTSHFGINQNAYYNQWIDKALYYGIINVQLGDNTGESAGSTIVGFDEIEIIY